MKRMILVVLLALGFILSSSHIYAGNGFYVIPVRAKSINIVWKGEWSELTAYAVNDAVGYKGSSYVAIAASTNEFPTNITYWDLLAAKGDKGDTGPIGPAGPIAGTDKQFTYNDGGNGGGAEVYYNKTTGNVGIGTTSPQGILHTYGDDKYFVMQRSANTEYHGIKWMTSSTIDWFIGEREISDSNFHIYSFGTEVDAVTVLKTNGNVGIGITTPSYKLEVNGVVAGTSFHNTSSKDYKKNIQTIAETEYPMMLSKVMNMVPKRYEYKKEYGGDETRKLGFIAEDMPEEVLSKNGKAVDLYELLTLAIGAMKAQQQRIEDLEAQVERLTSR